jgi:hypothetical protein
MDCARWNDILIGRLAEHLTSCSACRVTLDELGRVRTILAEDEPDVPRLPRVVVLRGGSRWKNTAIAASILGAALLAGTGVGAGYALGARRPAASNPVAAAPAAPTALDPATESLVRNEVERRLAAYLAARPQASPQKSPAAAAAVTPAEFESQLARLQRKFDTSRAADVDYLLNQIEASEVRIGTRLGKTNEALRNVALASNPYMGSQ